MNRADLIEAFGISVNQASTDLNRYISIASGNITLDKGAKTYIRGTKFSPLFLKPDASRFLSRLRSAADGILDRADARTGELPAYNAAPTAARGLNAETLQSNVSAIRRSKAIEVNCQLLSRCEPRWCWIAPHAIAFEGFRWHSRAFCSIDQSFKDFLLSRIIATRSVSQSDVGDEGDVDWHTHVTLEIGPHPDLSEAQQRVIALDYGMPDGTAIIPVRKALLYYALKRLGLDTDPAAQRPQDQQIVLLNRDVVHLENGNRAQ